jgi:hypothetical protein
MHREARASRFLVDWLCLYDTVIGIEGQVDDTGVVVQSGFHNLCITTSSAKKEGKGPSSPAPICFPFTRFFYVLLDLAYMYC